MWIHTIERTRSPFVKRNNSWGDQPSLQWKKIRNHFRNLTQAITPIYISLWAIKAVYNIFLFQKNSCGNGRMHTLIYINYISTSELTNALHKSKKLAPLEWLILWCNIFLYFSTNTRNVEELLSPMLLNSMYKPQ